MVVQLEPKHRRERDRRQERHGRDGLPQSRLLHDAWEQGLLSDDEYRAATDRLVRFGVPYLTDLR